MTKSVITFPASPGVAVAAVAILALAACAPEDTAEFDEADPAAATASSSSEEDAGEAESEQDSEAAGAESEDHVVAEIDEPVDFPECEQAEDDGATVTWLDDVVMEEQKLEGSESVTVDIDGEAVVIPGMPAVTVPERRAQAGCLIEYDAPGNCLPAVEISGA